MKGAAAALLSPLASEPCDSLSGVFNFRFLRIKNVTSAYVVQIDFGFQNHVILLYLSLAIQAFFSPFSSKPMPRSRKNLYRRSRRGGNTRRMPRELPPTSLAYSGPVSSPIFRQEQQLYTTLLSFWEGAATNGSAQFNYSLGNAPNSSPNWNALAGVFDEYRVLAMSVKYAPNDRYDLAVSVGTTPVLVVIDRDTSLGLTSATQAAQYESVVMKNSSDPWTIKVNMSSSSEAQYLSTASPSSTWWVKMVGSQSLAVSTTLGYFLIQYRVQFRGLGI